MFSNTGFSAPTDGPVPASFGQVEGVLDGKVMGWVRATAGFAAPPVVEIWINEVPVGLSRSDQPFFIEGALRYRFAVALPTDLVGGEPIRVRLANTGAELAGSPLLAPVIAKRVPQPLGYVDRAEGPTILGWVIDEADAGSQLTVVAVHDGVDIARAVANRFRADLVAAGIAGDHAFRLNVPMALGDGQTREIAVMVEAGERRVRLDTVDVVFRPEGPHRLARWLAEETGRSGLRNASEAARLLETFLFHNQSRHPWTIPFSDYPLWQSLFAPPPPPAVPAACAVTVVIDSMDGNAGLARTWASLQAQSHPPSRVILLVDPGVDCATANVQFVGDARRPVIVDRARAITDLPSFLPESHSRLVAIRAGDHLHHDCLRHLAAAPDSADLVYADSEVIAPDRSETLPDFKPDWNYDLFLSGNYLAPAWAIHRRVLVTAAMTATIPATNWHDLPFLAVEFANPATILHLPYVLGSAPVRSDAEQRADDDRRALTRHLARTGRSADVVASGSPRFPSRVRWRPPATWPLVSVIIPTRDRADLLSRCIDSLRPLFATGRVECLIADNGSTEPDTHAYFHQLRVQGLARIIDCSGPFNYSAINTRAAAAANGTILCFLNNDIVIPPGTTADWLADILGYFTRREVGAVGIKLVYDDGLVQHGGVILGALGRAEHAFRRLRQNDPGYAGRAIRDQRLSAVTAAAMFVRREAFVAVGGFDADAFAVAFNDVDLCLRLGAAGWTIVWTPHTWAFHLESASRGAEISVRDRNRLEGEAARLREKWGPLLDNDPCYNPNLGADETPFSGLALPPRRRFRLPMES